MADNGPVFLHDSLPICHYLCAVIHFITWKCGHESAGKALAQARFQRLM